MAATTSSRSRPEPKVLNRTTKSGRKLTYQLSVIQEPERARACGSGAKSSADRRPVDPPPVVELKIFEGEGAEKTDITFSYNANFFLFATLEMARPMAHGRMQPSSTTIPVLTGMPVSGMAYLDRPTEAGYFIFPDLSVRHEGKYKLSFNLYEETKNEGDGDPVPANDQKPKVPGTGSPDSSFDWRLEVKSAAFTVFSAKKFPGLAESTTLSRTVAEQGCRVRIRRDVRMRRRSGKEGGDDYDDVAEEQYVRAGRDQLAQDPYGVRSRSNSSDGGDRQPYHEERRMSGDFSAQPYGRPASYLDFGNQSNGQYQAPAPHFATPAPPAQPSYQSAPCHAGPSFRPAPLPQPASGPYGNDRQWHPQSAYPTNPPREREFEPEQFRRASVAGPYPPAGPSNTSYPSVDTSFINRTGYQGHPLRAQSPAPQTPIKLNPLKIVSSDSKVDGHSSPLVSISHVVATPLASPSYERNGSYSQYPAPFPSASDAPRLGKRSYETGFPQSTARQNEPLFDGHRPSLIDSKDGENDEEDMEEPTPDMQYKRADGKYVNRNFNSSYAD